MSVTFESKRSAPLQATMRAAVVVAPGRVEITSAELPLPKSTEVRVKIESCGVCASNLSPWAGAPWFTYPMEPGALGHEACGRIDAVGAELSGWREGERVALLSQRAYAEYDVVTPDSMVRLPGALDGTPFPGEPLGCAMNIFQRAEIRSGDTVAMVGIGFLGALLTQLAVDAGARVLAIARRPFAQEIAREAGAAEVIPMDDHWQIIERVRELTGGRFCDVTLESTGKQWPLDLGAELTRERGRLVIAGYHQDGPRQVNMQLWNWRGLDVINAHEREPRIYREGMEAAVRAVQAGRLRPAALYTHQLPLEQLGEALDLTRDRPEGFMKALITL
jgi:threonine dehydrogenase-like Zn-dependent dehydrogenase